MSAEDYAEQFADVDGTFLEMIDLEEIDLNLYRANFVFPDPYSLYGGQVAAQALRAAGLSVKQDRLPHSMHGYFLRPGNSSKPTVFQVFRDRDGRSYSARRVVALQGGEVIFSMSASFHLSEDGPDDQAVQMPDVPEPADCPSFVMPRLFSYEGRSVPQPFDTDEMPTRFWARCDTRLDDPFLNACALLYLSDISSGLARFDNEEHAASSSLDHAVWFHRPLEASEWTLMDMVPHSIAGGRGWYTGSIFSQSGVLAASLAQETLFRKRRKR